MIFFNRIGKFKNGFFSFGYILFAGGYFAEDVILQGNEQIAFNIIDSDTTADIPELDKVSCIQSCTKWIGMQSASIFELIVENVFHTKPKKMTCFHPYQFHKL